MSALGAPQLRRAFGALGGREARAVEGGTQRWRGPLQGAIVGAVILGAILGYTNSSPDSLHASPTGGSVSTNSGERSMKYPKSLTSIAIAAAFICESANAQQAVQWRVEDGGNGHWYGIRAGASSWNAANTAAIAIGGHLACVNSIAEHEWIVSHHLVPNPSLFISSGGWGPHIGGVQAVGAPEPLGGWSWIDGQPVVCAPTLCVMENCCGGQDRLTYQRSGSPVHFEFNDIAAAQVTNTTGSIVEWSADCDGDSIVDYGQILSGELDDTNGNNIPDCCEQGTPCACPGDVIENGVVDSIDLSAVLSTWGTNGGDYPRADINHDGIVAAEDLGTILAAWGACP